jgi:hypothetical protein
MTALEARLEAHCRSVWRGWDAMPEIDKAHWRGIYRGVIEAQMRAEEQRP